MEQAPTTAPGPDYRLVVVSDTEIRAFPLEGTRWIIGRNADCDLCLADPSVSRRHVVLERLDSGFRFADLGSVNPVLLDGRVAKSGALLEGQTLLVGTTRLTLDRRQQGVPVATDPTQTAEMRREELRPGSGPPSRVSPSDLDPVELATVIDSLEWAVADLTAPEDLAPALLELAMTLTGRRRGVLGTFGAAGFEPLASIDVRQPQSTMRLPEQVLREVRRGATDPLLLTHQAHGELQQRLVIPLGPGPSGLIVLTTSRSEHRDGQGLLQLARALGTLIWRRLQQAQRHRQLLAELTLHRATATHACTSPRLLEVRSALRASAHFAEPTMLLGERGTETAELARYAHAIGRRPDAPFEPVRVRELDAGKLAAALFGEEDAPGSVARAAGGTLFVDEPELLPPELQHRLAAELPDDVYLIAASTARPGGAAWTDELRLCFAHRVLELPPLRSDARDVLALSERILTELGPHPDGSQRTLGDGARRALAQYPWPGNVDELRAALEVAAQNAGAQAIAPRHLPEEIQQHAAAEPPIETLEEVERRHIEATLQRIGGNRTRAAQALGIAASTLYEKLKRYDIKD